MKSWIEDEIRNSIAGKIELLEDQQLLMQLQSIGDKLLKCIEAGGQILLAGNGGSAADAQHIAAEFVSKLAIDRAPLSARSLCTDPSIITALGNDYGFGEVFRRQLEGIQNKNDIFIGITTSGNSQNINNAFNYCIENELKCICLTSRRADYTKFEGLDVIAVPGLNTARIQELHILVGHILCKYVEDTLFN